MLEETLEEANTELERELLSEMITIMFQQRGDDVAQGQVGQLEDPLAEAHHLQRGLDGRQAMQLIRKAHAILRQEGRYHSLRHQVVPWHGQWLHNKAEGNMRLKSYSPLKM